MIQPSDKEKIKFLQSVCKRAGKQIKLLQDTITKLEKRLHSSTCCGCSPIPTDPSKYIFSVASAWAMSAWYCASNASSIALFM